MILAAADIGSNTVHLLIGDTDGLIVRRLVNESDWLSLGEVVSRQKKIPAAESDLLLATLARFQQLTKTHKAERFYVFATEAMRVAENHEAVLERLRKALKIKVDLITPEREAELSWRGVQIDAESVGPTALIEIGGGSAQVALCDGERVQKDISLPLGTGRLIAQTRLSYPCDPVEVEQLTELINRIVEPIKTLDTPRRAVASGGVARGIWRAIHPDSDREVHVEELRYIEWVCQRLTVERIALRFNVRSKRAQTLLPGAIAFRRLLEELNQESMMISEYGVREGALIEMFHRGKK